MNTDRFKFRVFLKSENRYAKETEYDELFWLSMDGRLFIDDGYDRPQYINYPDDKYKEGPRNIEDYVLEQCTGLKDANDKPIFEGDIAKSKSGNVFVVAWDAVKCRWMRKKRDGFWFDLREEIKQAPLRIIGNIHENPELLEA